MPRTFILARARAALKAAEQRFARTQRELEDKALEYTSEAKRGAWSAENFRGTLNRAARDFVQAEVALTRAKARAHKVEREEAYRLQDAKLGTPEHCADCRMLFARGDGPRPEEHGGRRFISAPCDRFRPNCSIPGICWCGHSGEKHAESAGGGRDAWMLAMRGAEALERARARGLVS